MWFNDAANFQSAVADAFRARDSAFRWMIGEGLRSPWPKVFAALGSSLDPADMPRIKEMAGSEKLSVGKEVLALDVIWRKAVVSQVGDAIDVKIQGWK